LSTPAHLSGPPPDSVRNSHPRGAIGRDPGLATCPDNRSGIVILTDQHSLSQGPRYTASRRSASSGTARCASHLSEATLFAVRYDKNIRDIDRYLKEQSVSNTAVRIAASRKSLVIAHTIYERGSTSRVPIEKTGGALDAASSSRSSVARSVQARLRRT
jgi:hypothetical protein